MPSTPTTRIKQNQKQATTAGGEKNTKGRVDKEFHDRTFTVFPHNNVGNCIKISNYVSSTFLTSFTLQISFISNSRGPNRLALAINTTNTCVFLLLLRMIVLTFAFK